MGKVGVGTLWPHCNNERGSAMVTALIASVLVVAVSYSSYQRFGNTKESFRLSRVKSLMNAVELQVRNRALQPEAYAGCASGAAGCHVNEAFFSDLLSQTVLGASCPPKQPKCGIQLTIAPFQPATRLFRAELRYLGKEVNPKPLMVALDVPLEILQAEIFHCGLINPDTPVFTGFDSSSRLPICKGFNTCGNGEFVHKVDVSRRTLSCKPLPPATNCAPQEFINSFRWQGAAVDFTCAGLPAPHYDLSTSPACAAMDLVKARASMIKFQDIPVTTLATACIDDVNPAMEDSLPVGSYRTIRFLNTCGRRWCQQQGHYTGRGLKIFGDQVNLECRMQSPPADTPSACKTFLEAKPPVKLFTTSEVEIAQGCIDPAAPALEDSLPATSDASAARFVTTCGNRYCQAKGYFSGRMVEFHGGIAVAECFDSNAETADDGKSRMMAIDATKDQVAESCRDSEHPETHQNLPDKDQYRFMSTCGNAYCLQMNYGSGKVVEIDPSGRVILHCFDPNEKKTEP